MTGAALAEALIARDLFVDWSNELDLISRPCDFKEVAWLTIGGFVEFETLIDFDSTKIGSIGCVYFGSFKIEVRFTGS